MDLSLLITILQFAVLVIFAIGFYRAAEVDQAPPGLWAGASIGGYAYTWLHLHCGFAGNAVGQVVVLVGIGVVRAAITIWRSHGKP